MNANPITKLSLLVIPLLCFAVACHDDHHHGSSTVVVGFDIGLPQGGVLARDFQSIADYLSHPTVQLILSNMPRHTGSSPPAVDGTYDAFGQVIATTVPGSLVGDPAGAQFCFGIAGGAQLEVRILDPSVEDAGAASFIEGSGDVFTVFTAFRSVQTLVTGESCEIHQVTIFSGRREADGSLSDLNIGFGVVGLLGICDPFLIGDIQISLTTGARTGGPCTAPPSGPSDLSKVLVIVDNFLFNDILLFLDNDIDPSEQVFAGNFVAFEVDPGFSLFFQSVPPTVDDGQGGLLDVGEIVAGQFPPDPGLAGETVNVVVENVVGTDEFFAPRPVNLTGEGIFSVVNVGNTAIPGYPADGSGLDCFCIIDPSAFPVDIGYYTHDAPGLINANDANVHFFRLDETLVAPPFFGPFPLEAGSGAVVLQVP